MNGDGMIAYMLQVSTHDWYERRGYTVYKRVDAYYNDVDDTGKKWGTDAVFMRKNIL